MLEFVTLHVDDGGVLAIHAMHRMMACQVMMAKITSTG